MKGWIELLMLDKDNCYHLTLCKLTYLTSYTSHGFMILTPILARQIKKKQSTNIKRDEFNIMNIINDKIFYQHKSPLNNGNRHMKVTLKSKLIGVTR